MAKKARSSSSSCELPARWDPDTSSWRTCQPSLLGEWEMFSGRWPRSGMMRNGIASVLPTLAHRISGTGSSSSGTGSESWPTPRATDATKGTRTPEGAKREISRRKSPDLPTVVAVREFWPTPTCRDWKSGQASANTLERNSRPLNEVIESRVRMWNTPAAGDSHIAGPNQKIATLGRQVRREEGSGRLNPEWVEWLMGFPRGWTELNA